MTTLEAFTKCYISTALWSSFEESMLDLDISEELQAKFEADCKEFYEANQEAIHCEGAPYARDFEGPVKNLEAGMAGHDFWLTRCGHGAGFWDGDWPEPYATYLTEKAEELGNVDLYIGDDGLAYC
jgi:hypothetical protein